MDKTTEMMHCPFHGIPDCSPLFNGCTLPIRAAKHRQFGIVEQPPEPKGLLAVVLDIRGLRYFRWAYDVHTSSPWQLMGAVHVCDEDPEFFRWDDLPPVVVVSRGLAD